VRECVVCMLYHYVVVDAKVFHAAYAQCSSLIHLIEDRVFNVTFRSIRGCNPL